MIQCFIGYFEVTEYLKPGWALSLKSYQRSTFEFEITDSEDIEIALGDHVSLFDGDNWIFKGPIVTFEISDASGNANEIKNVSISCVDNEYVCDKRRVSAVIDNELAEDAITNYIMPILQSEGITVGRIDADFTIIRDVWRYFKISEVLDRIKSLKSNYVWYINTYNEFYFMPKDTLATKTLTKDQIFNTRHRMSIENYYNTLYLTGSGNMVRTATQSHEVLSPLADGSTRTFTSRFPVATVDSLWYSTDGSSWNLVSSTDIGVNGIDTDKKWWWSYQSNTITQDTSETVLPAGGKVMITYVGLRPLLLKSENLEAINERAVSGGDISGIYEHMEEIAGIDDLAQATQILQALITKYCEVADKVTFSTYEYIDINSRLFMDLPFFNFSGLLSIDSINVTQSLDNPTAVYNVVALDSVSLGGWESYFIDLIKAQQRFTLDETSILQEIRSVAEKSSLIGSTECKVWAGLTIPCYVSESTILGGTLEGSLIIYD